MVNQNAISRASQWLPQFAQNAEDRCQRSLVDASFA